MKVTLILACAGKGERAGFGKNKLLVRDADGKTVLERTLNKFIDSGKIDEYVLTVSPADYEFVKGIVPEYCKLVLGGDTRTQSVKNALSETTGEIVLIHDGARPFVSYDLIADCISAAKKHGGCVPALPCRDTILNSKGEFADEYLGKTELYTVQTPQGFNTNLLKDAYARAGDKVFNDDGEVYKTYISPPAIIKGEAENIKLTYHEDFSYQTAVCRVGVGFDCHRLAENRKLILGGVEIPHDKGLLGHSDADVLTHAVMDAILSALAMRDIGYHFSDKDPQYKDADSMELLQKVLKMIDGKGYKVKSLSACIMAEKPKLLKYIPNITQNLANALNIPADAVGIGATTLEGLGFVGREEGICARSTAVLIEK